MKYKIAIVHDWLVTNAGAEKVLRSIIDLYPEADLYSIVNFLDAKQSEVVVNNKKVITSFIQNLPFAKTHFRHYLPLFPKAIESFNLEQYDLIISSSWAFAKGIKKNSNQKHICYCYTPIRYAWDLFEEYTSDLPPIKKQIVKFILNKIKLWDLRNSNNVDFFIADSYFVQERIKRIYNRESTVIYPPIDVNKFTLCTQKKDFYLTASRLVSYKKVKLIVEAFNQMPYKQLIVIGDGEEYKLIKSIANANIMVLGYQEDTILIKYMQEAKAFVYAAVEDFGIVPIEAMACGTPVIALNEGGTKETIKHLFNGIHFQHQTTKDIKDAIELFEKTNFNYDAISKDTQKYINFAKSFKAIVESVMK